MRADRLISILLLLQVHSRITAHDLARRFEVSERTIHRDMEALSAIGIPVVAERGVGGGWGFIENYRTNLTGLNNEEIRALFLAKPDRLLEDLGLEKASKAASIKLLAALPAAGRSIAEYARQRIHIDLGGWNGSLEPISALPRIQVGIWNTRKISFDYERGAGCESVARIVDPLGLVAKGTAWYLMAGIDGVIRSYRVSRMKNVEVSDQSCVRPPDFDLARAWDESMTAFKQSVPRYEATFLVDSETLPRLAYSGRFSRIGRVEPHGKNGWNRVRMTFQFEWEACEFATGLGTRLVVLEPLKLRELVISQARRIIESYNSKADAPIHASFGRAQP
jgi:predicted DNA-binding transcriptional regulator YafY